LLEKYNYSWEIVMSSGRLRMLVGLASLLVIPQALLAHEAGGDERVIPLLHQALPEMAGKTGLLVRVDYAPGQASVAHTHPGSVFAYVLEGEVVSQLEGQQPHTYKAGESWYETPHIKHLVSKNASATKPAKLLVWLVVGDKEQATTALTK
jgi:quercetin dioxygenase-like cupin family protein